MSEEELRKQLEAILEKVYLAGYRDSTRRASGAKPQAHVSGLKIIALINQYCQERVREAEIQELIYWFGNGNHERFNHITRALINQRYAELEAPWLSHQDNKAKPEGKQP